MLPTNTDFADRFRHNPWSATRPPFALQTPGCKPVHVRLPASYAPDAYFASDIKAVPILLNICLTRTMKMEYNVDFTRTYAHVC